MFCFALKTWQPSLDAFFDLAAGHPTSPFGSSNSSVRTTPDPYSSQSDDRITPGSSIGGHLGLGYNYGAANTTTSGDNWGAPQAAVPATGGATVAHANIQVSV